MDHCGVLEAPDGAERHALAAIDAQRSGLACWEKHVDPVGVHGSPGRVLKLVVGLDPLRRLDHHGIHL
jgi:hypothetical protein